MELSFNDSDDNNNFHNTHQICFIFIDHVNNFQVLCVLRLLKKKWIFSDFFITKLEGGVYWIHLVRPSVRLPVRLSVDDMVSRA